MKQHRFFWLCDKIDVDFSMPRRFHIATLDSYGGWWPSNWNNNGEPYTKEKVEKNFIILAEIRIPYSVKQETKEDTE